MLNNEEETDELNSDLEKEHFFKIIQAFKSYRSFSRSLINKRLTYLESLPKEQQMAMYRYRQKLVEVLKCIEQNDKIIKLIIKDVEKLFENVQHSKAPSMEAPRIKVSDVEKVQITLKQFYRDWSKDGEEERDQCYKPIIDELERRFPKNEEKQRQEISVLVPGAGLGRLAFEIARRGFSCQGNEFSLFMLFASNFILNRCTGIDMYELYPWTQSCDNNYSPQDMITPIKFPDIDPSELYKVFGCSTRFTMVAGDFLEVYDKDEEWDCVATCFFIDCANNIYTFIEKIYKILKPGGIWINLGPLQYHFSTTLDQDSIEPSFLVVKDIISAIGFTILKEETFIRTTYCFNKFSMNNQSYNSVFLVSTKPDQKLIG